MALYLDHAATYYAGSREYANLRATLGRLRDDCGDTPADAFRAASLMAWRDHLVDLGTLSRPHINRMVHHVRRMVRWAVSLELVEPNTLVSLQAVPAIKRGRSAAREPDPVTPVPLDRVDATLAHLPPDVADIVRVLVLTGARTGEVRTMRCGDVDLSGPVWLYRPRTHKAAHHGRARVIPLDAPCQAVIMPRLRPFLPDDYVFPSPRGGCYAEGSVRNAVRHACQRAGVAAWHPHQLRHTYLTAVRQALPDDPDAWRAAAGHSHVRTSELYAVADARRAVDAQAAVRRLGP